MSLNILSHTGMLGGCFYFDLKWRRGREGGSERISREGSTYGGGIIDYWNYFLVLKWSP